MDRVVSVCVGGESAGDLGREPGEHRALGLAQQHLQHHTIDSATSAQYTCPHCAPNAVPSMVRMSPPRTEEEVGDTAETAGVSEAS